MDKHKQDSTTTKQMKGRKWTPENMALAYKDVKCGRLSMSAAAKKYGVPRMTLCDRVNGRVQMNAKWGNETALNKEEEDSLLQYIEFMAKRGFPLTVGQITGFAWCIAKDRGKGDMFKKSGPSRKWWRGFKKRHPQLRLRRPDSLDRGRATKGNVHSIREYFAILKETMDANDLHNKPHLVFNCDEAAINLNKSAGQRVVVTSNQKHSHSVTAATNEHITVHCCVNAAGSSIPPMIIFTKTFPGGSYHKNGPVNATYATSDSGFMDSHIYFQWFEKTFLKFAPPERPLLLIQDGASSHTSCALIKSAMANDVIILCLPPKTTHITQPLDVAVYRKLKIEASNIMSHAKLIKSDLWISKKNVTSMLRIIYEKSFTMRCITEGFKKCGIYPFNPNAVDKSLLLRSCDIVDEEDIDLSINEQDLSLTTASPVEPLASSSPKLTNEDNTENPEPLTFTFVVGEDGILNLQTAPDTGANTEDNQYPDPVGNTEAPVECPPALALNAVESSLTPRKKRKYIECLNFNIDLPDDDLYQTWKRFKLKIVDSGDVPEERNVDIFQNPGGIPSDNNKSPSHQFEFTAAKLEDVSSRPPSPPKMHPLVKAGLIPEDLAEILVTPNYERKATPSQKSKKKARILTSQEVEQELIERETLKKEKEERIRKNKEERERKRVEKAIAAAKRKEKMIQRKELREKMKAEKEKIKKEKCDARKSKIINMGDST